MCVFKHELFIDKKRNINSAVYKGGGKNLLSFQWQLLFIFPIPVTNCTVLSPMNTPVNEQHTDMQGAQSCRPFAFTSSLQGGGGGGGGGRGGVGGR